MEFSAKKYVLEQTYPMSKETVWKLLSDTDRLNRFIGLFPVGFSNAKKNPNSVFHRMALAKVAGIIPLYWEESPFQWVEFESYSVERRYQSGPLKHFIGGVKLFDTENKSLPTKVRLFGEFTPRNPLGIAAIPITGLKSMKNTMKYLDEYLKINKDEKAVYYPQKHATHRINSSELKRLEILLQDMPIEPEYIERLHRYLEKQSDQDVSKMRPIPIAQEWSLDSDQVLRLFLYATKVGIVNLSWNLICPNCRVTKKEYASLVHLENQFHCDLCGINYDANFEKYVELSFSVHSSIRKANSQTYCVGGPMITPHVKVQKK